MDIYYPGIEKDEEDADFAFALAEKAMESARAGAEEAQELLASHATATQAGADGTLLRRRHERVEAEIREHWENYHRSFRLGFDAIANPRLHKAIMDRYFPGADDRG